MPFLSKSFHCRRVDAPCHPLPCPRSSSLFLCHVQACDSSPFRGRASLCYSLAERVYSTPLPSVGRRCNSFAPRSKAHAMLFRCGFDGRLFWERNNDIAVMFCESRVKCYANVTSEACTSAGHAFCEIFTSGRVPARFCADARGLCLFAAYVAFCGEFARRVQTYGKRRKFAPAASLRLLRRKT